MFEQGHQRLQRHTGVDQRGRVGYLYLILRKRLLFAILGVRHVRHVEVCGRSCGLLQQTQRTLPELRWILTGHRFQSSYTDRNYTRCTSILMAPMLMPRRKQA